VDAAPPHSPSRSSPFVVADASGANTLIAAFVAGLAYRIAAERDGETLAEVPEHTAEVLSWVTWFIFGAAMVIPALEHLDIRIVAYAVGSLTAVRVLAIVISLAGARADIRTRLFLGWSGPRGLATVVFGLIIVDELGVTDPSVRTVESVLAFTVVLSVIVHGLTAAPTSRWLTRHQPTATADLDR
jgi:NhaP-type Na+/H+ or K+/H+ antiporter